MEKEKMIKLIVADMDGTLLNDKHEIHPDFWKTEKALREKGIRFAVASGRQFYNLESKFDRVKNDILFFAENGTHVVEKGKDLYLTPLDTEAAREFIRIGRTVEGAQMVLCGKSSAYVECEHKRFLDEVKKYYERLEIVDDLTKVEDTFLKVTICDFQGVEDHSYHHFKKYANDFKVAIAASIFLDITNINANKGNAIKGVQKELAISPDETMAFGDYLNDLEMMQNARYSYAMKNAHPEIIEASKYVTKYTNNENGVLRTIEEFGLL